MSNIVFPVMPGLSWSVLKAPSTRTLIHQAVSGKELRLSLMSNPLWAFTLTYELLRAGSPFTEYQQLLSFWLDRSGAYDSFLYTDPSDNSVTAQSFGTGNGSTTTFQLLRSIYGGGFLEAVQNVNGAPSIYINGVLKTVTTDYTIGSTGIVTFVTAPAAAAALTWTGSFYYRVRFKQDTAEFEEFVNNFWLLKKLELQSIKL